MKTTNKPTKTNLLFDIHAINSLLQSLNFSLIYNELENENTQHYLKQLTERINNINFNQYINK